jgi:Transposase DDE domain
MKGSRLLKVLAFFHMLSDPGQREIERVVGASQEAQKALGGRVPRNTLSNALRHRDLEQMIEAWMMILQYYGPYIKQMGKKYARIAAVDASLIKLSLAAFSWATYREKTGAAKITCVLDWVKGVPQQFVFTASGKVHDLKATAALRWSAGWTYLFDRGYFSFDLLTVLLNVGAHFVIRLKQGVEYRIIRSDPVPDVKTPAGIRAIKSDQTVSLPGWASDVILRLVVYQLTDGKIIRVFTSRHDLSALSIAMLYKERWSIEMCQTQPVKMTWSPLRLFRLAINSLRGRFKRENEVDVNLFSGDDDSLNQALRHSLALFKRESFEIVAEQFPKRLGVVNDLAPVNGLLASA